MNPPNSVKEYLEYVEGSAVELKDTRSDLRAYGFDTFSYVIKSMAQIDRMMDGVQSLLNGTNCSVIIKKGLGSLLAAMCSFDKDNFSMLSSLLEISF